MKLPSTMLTVALALTAGCDAPTMTDGLDVELTPQEKAAVEAKAEADAQPQAAPPRELDENGVASDATAFTADSPEKGRKSKEAGGYLGAVAHSRFWAEHEMIRHSITHALNLFNATEGRYPESHEEFMEKIVKFNQISLPKLPAGQEYIYDPADNLLKVQAAE